MRTDLRLRKERSTLLCLAVAIVIYSILILAGNYYERVSGDTTLYLSIADNYVRGDFDSAINGYWGPLLSWILVPFRFAGASPAFAINALYLIFGVLTIIGVWKLSRSVAMGRAIRNIVLLLLVPVLYFMSLIQPMDFLLLCVLVFYLNAVMSDDYHERRSAAVQSGLLGALAYFSKPFGFPFFITHFLLMNFCHYLRVPLRKQKRQVLYNALLGFVVFFLLSSVWIGLISNKYGRLTFSNMGKGVLASYGTESAHGSMEKSSPMFFEGFFKPPNDRATVVYEDPSYAKEREWSQLTSPDRIRRYLGNMVGNIFQCLRILESFSRLSLAILIASVILLLSRRRMMQRGDLLYPIVTVALYIAGYLPFHFESRYLWIINILLLLLGGKVLTELFEFRMLRGTMVRSFLLLLFVLSFSVTPVKTSLAISRSGVNHAMHELAQELAKRYDLSGNIASNRQKVETTVFDSWHRTFRLAYWLKGRYFGIPQEGITDSELEGELVKYNIDYYFVWGEGNSPPEFCSAFRELTEGSIPGLKIYALNEPVGCEE